jgi:sugar lactone lactonase YvrE
VRPFAALALTSLAACAPDPCARPGLLCVVAGMPGQAGLSAEGLPATAARLYLPSDVLPDAGAPETFFLVDDNNHIVRHVDEDGGLRMIAGSSFLGDVPEGPARDSSLNHPASAALDPADPGLLWVAATGNHRVKRVDLGADWLTSEVGTGEPGWAGDGGDAADALLQRPTSLAFDGDGAMYVSDKLNHVIRQITPDGVIHTWAGSPGRRGYAGDGGPAADALLQSPLGLELENSNRLTVRGDRMVIADTGNHVLREVDLTTGLIRTIAGRGTPGHDPGETDPLAARLHNPYDAAIDDEGGVWFTDTGNHCVRHLTPDGALEDAVGACGTSGPAVEEVDPAEATLNWPSGVAIQDGWLWVCDTHNHVVRRLRLGGR